MQTRQLRLHWIGHVVAASALLLCPGAALGQGTLTFDGGAGISSTFYYESGLWFNVVIPAGSGYDDMGIIPPGAANHPQNSSPFMIFYRQYNPYDYVALSYTNGVRFGLTSVRLADPTSPSPSPVPISFVGHLAGGLTVTNTFTTPGNGATTFATYTFNSDFGWGLTSVDILAPKWAMDNLVFVIPEPGHCAMFCLGLLGFAARRRERREP